MWILILTVTAYTHGGANAAVATATGFASEASCMQAAATWMRQPVARADYTRVSAVCAKA